MQSGTLVAFHAHPDDEALLCSGTLAKAHSLGIRTVLVFATRGEVGDVGEGVLEDAESLGDRRSAEARKSADVLGVDALYFLDYLDSGSQPNQQMGSESFCQVEVSVAAEKLAEILRRENADLLIADDRNGGYGHPDHVQVHKVAWEASNQTSIPFFQVTIDRDFLSGGIELAKSLGIEVPEGFVPPDISQWYSPANVITHFVDVSAQLPQRKQSMAAHATQTTGSTDAVRTLSIFVNLPDEIFAIAFAKEWFVQANGEIPTPFLDLFTANV